MTYVKQTWVDQEGQVRYSETTDGSYKIFTPNYDNVTEMGTPVNALNMNHIEDGIEDCDVNMVKRKSTSQSTGSTTQPVYVKADGVVEVCEISMDNSRFDGQWVNAYHELSTANKGGIYTIDLSSYLPAGSVYEVQLIAHGSHTGDGNKYQTVYSSIIRTTQAFNMVGSYADRSRGSIILPVGTDRQITYNISANLTSGYLYMIAYRRIGTNL